MTNGDRLRKMSDKELAEIVSGYLVCNECPLQDNPGYVCDCVHGALLWLEKEASSDETD